MSIFFRYSGCYNKEGSKSYRGNYLSYLEFIRKIEGFGRYNDLGIWLEGDLVLRNLIIVIFFIFVIKVSGI